MAIITSYPDDNATSSDDKFLTVDNSGSTVLTSAATLKDYILAPGNVTTDTLAQSAVTDDKWVNGVAFLAKLASHQSQTNTTSVRVAFSSMEFDIGSNFDTSNNRFVAPVKGVYSFSATIAHMDAASTTARGLFNKNGSLICWMGELRGSGSGDFDNAALSGSVVVSLNKDDYVDVWSTRAGSTGNIHASYSQFSGHLVTRTS